MDSKELSTQQKGLISEKEVELFFSKLGYLVSIPNYYHSRYDMIVDINNQLYKVQVKTAHKSRSGNGIELNAYSTGRNLEGNHKKGYGEEEVDLFALSYEGQVYIIPLKSLQGSKCRTLQFEKPINATILYLNDFKGEKILQFLTCHSLNELEIVKKPIKQYDKDGVFIAEYTSTIEAIKTVKPETKNARQDAGHISEVINGQRKSAYGYIWKRED